MWLKGTSRAAAARLAMCANVGEAKMVIFYATDYVKNNYLPF